MADSRITTAQKRAGQIATSKGALNQKSTFILGIFGTSSAMEAMIREPYRGTRRVKAGDMTSMGKIRAIDAKGLLIEQDGKVRRLGLVD